MANKKLTPLQEAQRAARALFTVVDLVRHRLFEDVAPIPSDASIAQIITELAAGIDDLKHKLQVATARAVAAEAALAALRARVGELEPPA